jgi:hypothetical protein
LNRRLICPTRLLPAARRFALAPFPAVALMFAGSVKNRLRQRDGFNRNIIQVTIT